MLSKTRKRPRRRQYDRLRLTPRHDHDHSTNCMPSTTPPRPAALIPLARRRQKYSLQSIQFGLLGTGIMILVWITLNLTGGSQDDGTFFSRFMSTHHYIKPEVVYPRMSRGVGSDYNSEDDAFQLPRSKRFVSPMGDKKVYEKIKRSKDYRELNDPALADGQDCQPQHEWQRTSYPACNNMHEFDWTSPTMENGEQRYKVLTRGYYRAVWSMYDDTMMQAVFKPMLMSHEFVFSNLDRMRRDALAMDRLKGEKYILDIYGFCGTSGFFEYADGGDLQQTIWPKHRKKPAIEIPKIQKLRIATQAAMGLASVHNVDMEGRASIAHTDIAPNQFMKVGDTYKLQDFNRARFLKWSQKDDEACPFFVENNGGKNRSPEEYQYGPETEKIDVYSFGNILYMLLQGEWPFYQLENEDAAELVKNGKRPRISKEIWNSTDPVDKVLKKAMIMCHHQHPEKRASARYVETYLKNAMAKLDPGRLEQWGDA